MNYPGGTLNAPQNPVHPGEYVVVYLTGQGIVDLRGGERGGIAGGPACPCRWPRCAHKLGGKPVEVAFAGLAPGFVGLLQVNLLMPGCAGAASSRSK